MAAQVLRERGRKYVGLPEFARVAGQILSDMQLEQERGTVTNVPDERTIRYYLAEGLIQAPEEKQGTASVFGYLNILQLVTVKKLQAEHLPIRKIRELVAGKSEQELETLLGVAGPARKKTRESEAKRYLESLLAPSMNEELAARPMQMPMQARAPSPRSRSSRQEQETEQYQTGQLRDTADHSWQRVEIEPGLELHIRSDYTPPATARSRSLLEKALDRLRRLRT